MRYVRNLWTGSPHDSHRQVRDRRRSSPASADSLCQRICHFLYDGFLSVNNQTLISGSMVTLILSAFSKMVLYAVSSEFSIASSNIILADIFSFSKIVNASVILCSQHFFALAALPFSFPLFTKIKYQSDQCDLVFTQISASPSSS